MKFPIIGTSLAWIVEERLESKPTEVSFAWSFDKALLAREVYEREGRRHPDRMYQIYFEVMVADTE